MAVEDQRCAGIFAQIEKPVDGRKKLNSKNIFRPEYMCVKSEHQNGRFDECLKNGQKGETDNRKTEMLPHIESGAAKNSHSARCGFVN